MFAAPRPRLRWTDVTRASASAPTRTGQQDWSFRHEGRDGPRRARQTRELAAVNGFVPAYIIQASGRSVRFYAPPSTNWVRMPDWHYFSTHDEMWCKFIASSDDELCDIIEAVHVWDKFKSIEVK